MADIKNGCEASADFKEAVCIDAGRVFDSCCDRDCLEDLRVYFGEEGQSLIANAVCVKIRSAEVINVLVDVEPVNLSRGFYACDLTFFFSVGVDVYTSPHSCPTEIKGISVFNKKVVLYGSDGNVKIFGNDSCENCQDNCSAQNGSTPRCIVQVAEPIALSAKIDQAKIGYDNIGIIPACVTRYIGGSLVTDTPSGSPAVYVTLGLFTIVQLIRNVQVLVPVYDFCIPEKQCDYTADQPCDVFKKIKFPTDDFFPKHTPCSNECGCGRADNK